VNQSDAGREEFTIRPRGSAGSVRPSEPDSLVDVRDLARSVVRSRWLVGSILVASLLAGIVITAFQDREYESEATIYVNPRKASLPMGLEMGRVAALAGIGEAGIVTETALLESRAVAEAVVDSLALHVRLEEPAVSYVNILRIGHAPRDARPGRFEFRLRADGTYSVESLLPFEASVPTSVVPGTPFRLGDVQLTLLPQPDRGALKVVIAIDRFDVAVRRVRRNLVVEPYARGAQILAVRARDPDSVRAAEIPNVASSRFIQYRTELTKAEARNAVGFLREQVDSYELRLMEAEDRLRGFREQSRVLSPGEEASQQVRHLADLQARRNLLVAERDAISTAIARAETRTRTEPGESPYRELAAFPVFLSNAAVQSVLRTLTELENEVSELLIRRTPDNDDVQRLVQRIEELERQLYRTARSYHDGLDNQIASLDASVNRFSRGLETVPQQQVAYARFLREQQLLEEVYTLLQTRLKEAEIREVEDLSDVRIIDAALIPERPVVPRPALNMLLAFVVGLTLGVGAAVTRAVLDPRVRTRDDVFMATAGLPVIGAIPRAGHATKNGLRAWGQQRLRGKLLRARAMQSGIAALVVRSDPEGEASEAYRALRTNLTFGTSERLPQLMTICSVAAGDGKSTTAANLALSMAQQGLRVLLVDCDLRRPRLHAFFGYARQPGIVDVLLGQAELHSTIRQIDIEDGPAGPTPLHLLTAGKEVSGTAEVIGSPAMRDLLQQVRGTYDLVILDAPPLGVASEAVVLGVLSDATLVVARATVTQKAALAEAVADLRRLRVPLAGIVINDLDPSESVYGGYRQGAGRSNRWTETVSS
jgi:capsular exopolysaccharide synthesis family protein